MEELTFSDELLEVASKRDDPNYLQISGHIPKEIATEFKVTCTRKGISLSEGLEDAISAWLENLEKPNKKPPASGGTGGKKNKD